MRSYYSADKTAFATNVLLVVILCIPALIGFVLNGAFYFPLRKLVYAKTKGTIFYDSLLFGLITTLYPLYILLMSLVIWLTTRVPFWAGLIIIPVTAWIGEQWYINLLKVRNYIVLKKEEILFSIVRGIQMHFAFSFASISEKRRVYPVCYFVHKLYIMRSRLSLGLYRPSVFSIIYFFPY